MRRDVTINGMSLPAERRLTFTGGIVQRTGLPKVNVKQAMRSPRTRQKPKNTVKPFEM
jgi:hypothetical protein